MIHELTVSLLASKASPAAVSEADFLTPLGVSATDAIVVMGPGSSRIDLAVVKHSKAEDRVEASEQFERDVSSSFERVEAWLGQRPPAVFEAIREHGVEMELLLDVWMDVDQLEFTLPPGLLLRLGERGLPFHLISND